MNLFHRIRRENESVLKIVYRNIVPTHGGPDTPWPGTSGGQAVISGSYLSKSRLPPLPECTGNIMRWTCSIPLTKSTGCAVFPHIPAASD